MEIVLAATARERGGTWRHVEDVAAELSARGHRVTIALPGGATGLQRAARAAGLDWRPLRGTLRGPGPWHLHQHDTFEPAVLALLAARRPFGPAIVTEHLPRTPGADRSLPGGRHAPALELARTAFKKLQTALSAVTVVPSHASERFLRWRYGLGPEAPTTVVPNGLRQLPPAPPPLPAGPMRVVSVGALIDQKGHDVLLAAARGSRHPWTMTIVGDGAWRARLERMAAALAPGRVRFAGWSDEPERHLREAHLLCMPSRYETLPYAALEAGAWARATVATRVDGLEEIVVDGRTGVLVARDDVAALRAALDGLWEDRPRLERMGAAARERVRAEYTVSRTVDALEALYARLAERA